MQPNSLNQIDTLVKSVSPSETSDKKKIILKRNFIDSMVVLESSFILFRYINGFPGSVVLKVCLPCHIDFLLPEKETALHVQYICNSADLGNYYSAKNN